MAEDIFNYNPISVWNGQIVDFGMPSTDGDVRLTEICLAADTCLEATKNAIALSFTSTAFVIARSSPVLKIVRTLFGEDTGIKIQTFTQFGEDGAIHYMSPMVFADMQIYEKNWIIDTIDLQNIGLNETSYDIWPVPYSDSNLPPYYIIGDEPSRRINTWRQTDALNPLAVGLITTGNRPITGNWDTDGEPYYEFNWDTISFGRCSDNVQTNQGTCTSTVIGGTCRVLHTSTWSSPGAPPLALDMPSGNLVEANIDYAGDYYCTYASTTGYTNGRCFWSWNNLDTETWHAWGSGSESTCMSYAANNWADRFWMWIAPGNAWTNQYAVWRPSYDGNHTDVHGNSDFIQGTVDSWKHFNIKTANNHRKYPINHIPSQTGTNLRIYHSDTNSSWGNGTEVGRSTIPTWVTNTFEWGDNDHTYDYCFDGLANPQTQWSAPSGYNDDVACLASGNCSGVQNAAAHPNDEPGCLSYPAYCSGGGHTSESACINSGYYWYDCSAGGWTNSTSCTNAGLCYLHIPGFGSFLLWDYQNNPSGCYAFPPCCGGYMSYTYYGYTWDAHWQNHNYTWYPQNVFTSDNYTWEHIVPDVDVEMHISAEYLWKPMFPPHTFVDTTDSRPLNEYGYTGNAYPASTQHASQSQIRWRPPQGSLPTPDYNRTYPRPTKFRIYRAPAYYQGLTSNTDYTEEIWKLAGEVTTKSDSGWHYFYDTREDMVNEGLREFQHAYYGITAVWEDWNWKRGFTIKYYANLDCSAWDIHDGQSWSAVVNNVNYDGICSNSNYTATGQESCEGNGACLPSNTHSQWHNDEVACLANGGTWSSSNYTWTPGQWNGNSNTGANLDYVENATPNVTYLQKHVRINDDTNNRTYRASGYFKAPVAGEYQFEIRADDSAYVWLGPDQQSVSGLIGQRTWYNYLTAVPGDHGDRWHTGTISLVKDGIYPFLAYQANETGPATFEIRIHYPDGDWNDGGNGAGEWKYVPILMGPEDMVLEDGGGQTVEGHWANTSVPSWYTNYP